jgi:hypothetical protein
LQVEVWRGGRAYCQTFSRGAPQSAMTDRPTVRGEPTSGTRVEFSFDRTVFAAGVAFDPEIVAARLREIAFLNSAATLRLRVTGGKQPAAIHPVVVHSAPAAAPKRRRSTKAAAGEADGGVDETGAAAAAAAEASNGNGTAAAVGPLGGAVDAEGWQVFHFEGGLQEYVQW